MFFWLRRTFYEEVGLAYRMARAKSLENLLPSNVLAARPASENTRVKLLDSDLIHPEDVSLPGHQEANMQALMDGQFDRIKKMQTVVVPITGLLIAGQAVVPFTFNAYLVRRNSQERWAPSCAIVEVLDQIHTLEFSEVEIKELFYGKGASHSSQPAQRAR